MNSDLNLVKINVLENDNSPDSNLKIMYYALYRDPDTFQAWFDWAFYNRVNSNNNVWDFEDIALTLWGEWPTFDSSFVSDFMCI